MRALWRHFLAPLVVAAAVLIAGAPAHSAGAAAAHPGHTALADGYCPAGTHWDGILHICK